MHSQLIAPHVQAFFAEYLASSDGSVRKPSSVVGTRSGYGSRFCATKPAWSPSESPATASRPRRRSAALACRMGTLATARACATWVAASA